MKWPSQITRRKLVRRIAMITILFLVLCGYAVTQLNFPYYTHASLADFQARMGLHAAKEREVAVQIIGHRGAGLANVEFEESQPERKFKPIGNTRTTIKEAIKAGVHWVEIDLRRSKDGTLVLFHDETVDDKTDGKGRVSELTDGQLRDLTISVDVEPAERILTLEEFKEEFLKDLIDSEIGLILDIKQAKLKKPVLGWIERAKDEKGLKADKLVVFGEFEILKEFAGKNLQLGYTFTWKQKWNRLLYLFREEEIINRLGELDAKFLVIPVVFTSKALVETAEKKGVETWIYGSDDQRDWDRVSGFGAKGLIVDYPSIAIDHFDADSRMKTNGEQAGADQTVTAPEESDSESNESLRPEPEARHK